MSYMAKAVEQNDNSYYTGQLWDKIQTFPEGPETVCDLDMSADDELNAVGQPVLEELKRLYSQVHELPNSIHSGSGQENVPSSSNSNSGAMTSMAGGSQQSLLNLPSLGTISNRKNTNKPPSLSNLRNKKKKKSFRINIEDLMQKDSAF